MEQEQKSHPLPPSPSLNPPPYLCVLLCSPSSTWTTTLTTDNLGRPADPRARRRLVNGCTDTRRSANHHRRCHRRRRCRCHLFDGRNCSTSSSCRGHGNRSVSGSRVLGHNNRKTVAEASRTRLRDRAATRFRRHRRHHHRHHGLTAWCTRQGPGSDRRSTRPRRRRSTCPPPGGRRGGRRRRRGRPRQRGRLARPVCR